MRLDKYLADAGCGTRSEVKKYIRSGAITVNGVLINKPEVHIDDEKDEVEINGQSVFYSQYVYYMMNKPAGVVSATIDNTCKTVIDILKNTPELAPNVKGVFPVGRLDKDTEGLLLLTNDGELAHRLLSPGKHVDKTYYAKVDGSIGEDDIKAFEKGIDIGESKLTLPAKLQVITSRCDLSEVKVTINEGKFHQIKRMFQARDRKVLFLKRLTMGNLILDDNLKAGYCRKLTPYEIQSIRQ